MLVVYLSNLCLTVILLIVHYVLSDTSKLPESRAETLENSSRILSVLPESTLNNEGEKKNPAFMLKDWTVIKGSSETELFVSGVLIDM